MRSIHDHHNRSTTKSIFMVSLYAFFFLVGLALIAGGIYVGIWLWLIGGIVQIIEAAKATPVDSHLLAWGLAKAIFFEVPVIGGFILGIVTWKVAVS